MAIKLLVLVAFIGFLMLASSLTSLVAFIATQVMPLLSVLAK